MVASNGLAEIAPEDQHIAFERLDAPSPTHAQAAPGGIGRSNRA